MGKIKNCEHNFINVKEVIHYLGDHWTLKKIGMRIVCSECGEVRDIWEDGIIEKYKHDTPKI